MMDGERGQVGRQCVALFQYGQQEMRCYGDSTEVPCLKQEETNVMWSDLFFRGSGVVVGLWRLAFGVWRLAFWLLAGFKGDCRREGNQTRLSMEWDMVPHDNASLPFFHLSPPHMSHANPFPSLGPTSSSLFILFLFFVSLFFLGYYRVYIQDLKGMGGLAHQGGKQFWGLIVAMTMCNGKWEWIN